MEAIEKYRQYRDGEDEEVDENLNGIQELISSNKINEAEKLLIQLSKSYPENSKVYLNLGEFYNKCQRYNDAIRTFQRGIEINPEFALFFRDIALSLRIVGREKEAIDALNKSIELGLEDNLEKHANILLKLWGN